MGIWICCRNARSNVTLGVRPPTERLLQSSIRSAPPRAAAAAALTNSTEISSRIFFFTDRAEHHNARSQIREPNRRRENAPRSLRAKTQSRWRPRRPNDYLGFRTELLYPTEGRKRGDGCAAQCHAEYHACKHVAEEMHAQHDARKTNAYG
jgi:hypothetical protein